MLLFFASNVYLQSCSSRKKLYKSTLTDTLLLSDFSKDATDVALQSYRVKFTLASYFSDDRIIFTVLHRIAPSALPEYR